MDLETTLKNAGIILGYSALNIYLVFMVGINSAGRFMNKYDLYRKEHPETSLADIRNYLGMLGESIYKSLNPFNEEGL